MKPFHIPATPWHLRPVAAAILRRCVANPPRPDLRTSTFERPYGMYRTDDRIKELTRLWKAEKLRLLPDPDAFAECARYGPDQAISEALFFAEFRLPTLLRDICRSAETQRVLGQTPIAA